MAFPSAQRVKLVKFAGDNTGCASRGKPLAAATSSRTGGLEIRGSSGMRRSMAVMSLLLGGMARTDADGAY